MNSDVQIRDQLTRALADGDPPPLGSLVADAVTAGIRLRLRRRLALATTGAASVAGLLAAAIFLASYAGGATTSAPAQWSAAVSPAVALAPKVAASSSPPPGVPVGQRATSGQAVVALLAELLPAAGNISEIDYVAQNGSASGIFVYDDGHGAASVSAGVADAPADYGPGVAGMQCPAGGGGLACQHNVEGEGTEVRVMTMGPYPTDCTELKCGIEDLRVEIKRPDGVYVMAEAYNGPFGQGRAPTRAHPLLTVAQLLAIAKNPRWGLTMDASFVVNAERMVHLSGKK